MVSSPTPPATPPPLEASAGAGADALIEVLHRLQQHRGWLDQEALRQAARQLRLPLSHVYGVASFYHLFLLQRPTPHRCAVCLGSACFVRGAMALAERVETQLGVRLDDPQGDGQWSLQRVGCLGACGQAPVLVVDDALVTRLPLDPADSGELERRLQQAGLPAAAGAPASRGDRQPAAEQRP